MYVLGLQLVYCIEVCRHVLHVIIAKIVELPYTHLLLGALHPSPTSAGTPYCMNAANTMHFESLTIRACLQNYSMYRFRMFFSKSSEFAIILSIGCILICKCCSLIKHLLTYATELLPYSLIVRRPSDTSVLHLQALTVLLTPVFPAQAHAFEISIHSSRIFFFKRILLLSTACL